MPGRRNDVGTAKERPTIYSREESGGWRAPLARVARCGKSSRRRSAAAWASRGTSTAGWSAGGQPRWVWRDANTLPWMRSSSGPVTTASCEALAHGTSSQAAPAPGGEEAEVGRARSPCDNGHPNGNPRWSADLLPSSPEVADALPSPSRPCRGATPSVAWKRNQYQRAPVRAGHDPLERGEHSREPQH